MMEAALQDCVGAVIEGQEGRHVAAVVDPAAFVGPQLLWPVLWQLLVCSSVMHRHGMVTLIFCQVE